ncbi:hypothetical protein CEP51_015467 [Fusarium floridanum]|uniref:Fungal-specific transcription factor domain-containing protein n=1 Tax=Fusarium floridanum TaxID=1325733 RepID=A0A428P974_9HYPO|nr:hypothetical protein CEP51_015467 [Fusarium floridanum]
METTKRQSCDNSSKASSLQVPQAIRWSPTIARSGRLKNVKSVFQPPQAARPTSRKKYRVRFQLDGLLPCLPAPDESIDVPPRATVEQGQLLSLDSLALAETAFGRQSSPIDCNSIVPIVSDGYTPTASTGHDEAEEQSHAPSLSPRWPAFRKEDAQPYGSEMQIPYLLPLITHPNSTQVGSTDASRYYQLYIQSALPRFTPLWLTVDNPFISTAIPASMDSPILQHALFALTAYWASRSSSSRPKDAVRTLWHKQKVLVLFRESLAAGDCASLPNLLACLFIQTIEIVDSGIGDWALWLQGVIMMLQGRDRLEADIVEASDWQVFTKCAVAMETMAAVSSGRTISISRAYWRAFLGDKSTRYRTCGEEMAVHQLCSQDLFFEKILGCPTVVLFVLCEIEHHASAVSDGRTRARGDDDYRLFNAWEDLLLRWTPTTSNDDMSINISEAYRFAALVHYARKIRKLPYRHASVQQYVAQALYHIQHFDYRRTSVNVIWPLMIASLELDAVERPDLKQSVLDILTNLGPDLTKLSLFENCAALLKLVWSRRQKSDLKGEEPLGWRDISEGVGWIWSFW